MHLWHTIQRYRKWPLRILGVVVVFYGIAVIVAIPEVLERERTEETIAELATIQLTMEDVTGEKLPPPVFPEYRDTTVEGIDANKNHIRDDVEHAIFERYPDDTTTRAAQLQYAMAMQLYFTHVFNGETMSAVGNFETRAKFCVWGLVPEPWPGVDILSLTEEELSELQKLSTERYVQERILTDEVKSLVLNTLERETYRDDLFSQFIGEMESERTQTPYCDVLVD